MNQLDRETAEKAAEELRIGVHVTTYFSME
jgi:hypothetical protein